MSNEEIVTALKNAIERNEDIDSAGETLVNAGYSMQDVQDAKNSLIKGVLASQVEAQKSMESEPKESFSKKLADKINSVSSGIKNIFKKKEIIRPIPEFKQPLEKVESPEPQNPIQTLKLAQIKPLPGIPKPISQKSSKNTLLITAIIILMMLILFLIILILFKKSILGLFG